MIKSFIGGYYASDKLFCLNSSLQTNLFIIWFSKLLQFVISICKLWSNKILSLSLSSSLSRSQWVEINEMCGRHGMTLSKLEGGEFGVFVNAEDAPMIMT